MFHTQRLQRTGKSRLRIHLEIGLHKVGETDGKNQIPVLAMMLASELWSRGTHERSILGVDDLELDLHGAPPKRTKTLCQSLLMA